MVSSPCVLQVYRDALPLKVQKTLVSTHCGAYLFVAGDSKSQANVLFHVVPSMKLVPIEQVLGGSMYIYSAFIKGIHEVTSFLMYAQRIRQ